MCEGGFVCDGCDGSLKPLVQVVGFGGKVWVIVAIFRVQCEIMSILQEVAPQHGGRCDIEGGHLGITI